MHSSDSLSTDIDIFNIIGGGGGDGGEGDGNGDTSNGRTKTWLSVTGVFMIIFFILALVGFLGWYLCVHPSTPAVIVVEKKTDSVAPSGTAPPVTK